MTNQKPLGMIRIGIVGNSPYGPFFDFPYFNEEMFTRMLTQIRADGFFNSGTCFIPMHAIGYIMQIPDGVIAASLAQAESFGETRQ